MWRRKPAFGPGIKGEIIYRVYRVIRGVLPLRTNNKQFFYVQWGIIPGRINFSLFKPTEICRGSWNVKYFFFSPNIVLIHWNYLLGYGIEFLRHIVVTSSREVPLNPVPFNLLFIGWSDVTLFLSTKDRGNTFRRNTYVQIYHLKNRYLRFSTQFCVCRYQVTFSTLDYYLFLKVKGRCIFRLLLL